MLISVIYATFANHINLYICPIDNCTKLRGYLSHEEQRRYTSAIEICAFTNFSVDMNNICKVLALCTFEQFLAQTKSFTQLTEGVPGRHIMLSQHQCSQSIEEKLLKAA